MKFNVGDTVIVHKPSVRRYDEPYWMPDMDKYIDRMFKISGISEKWKTVCLECIPWGFSIRWLEPSYEEKEEYFDTEDLDDLWNLK